MNLNHVTLFVTEIAQSIRFYEALGLKMIVHSPPRYARFLLPEGDSTLSVEVIEGARAVDAPQALIFLECRDLDAVCTRLSMAGIELMQQPTDMPYLWREARVRDPDGHEIRLYWAGTNRLYPPWRLKPESGDDKIWMVPWRGDRAQLSHLFRMADDSEQQIADYCYLGDVIAAVRGSELVGMAQIITSSNPLESELKSIAVMPAFRSNGVGRRLVRCATNHSRDLGAARLKVSTSVAAFDAIAFYLTLGFRISGFVRDAFTTERGYPPDASLDGLPLNDAVELEIDFRSPIAG